MKDFPNVGKGKRAASECRKGGPVIVRMFQPRFAPMVEAGTKLQTIRPWPKRCPAIGQRISLRAWTGKPYRSKQRVLAEGSVTDFKVVAIYPEDVVLDGVPVFDPDGFARADGFRDMADMLAWFAETHGLPFHGVMICWKPA